MNADTLSISVVIPLFNEANRLDNTFNELTFFLNSQENKKIEIIFIDDGSIDNSLRKLKLFKKSINSSNHKIIINSYITNKGKGYACKTGVLIANNDLILICDADMATKPNQLIEWIDKKFIDNEDVCYLGSRNHKASIIKSKINRKLIGRCLNILLYIFFKNRISDTQCGFKLFNKKYAKKIFGKLETNRFAYDIEIIQLLKINSIKIKELPIKWEHKEGSKISIFKDSLKMIIDIIKIKYKKNTNDRYFT